MPAQHAISAASSAIPVMSLAKSALHIVPQGSAQFAFMLGCNPSKYLIESGSEFRSRGSSVFQRAACMPAQHTPQHAMPCTRSAFRRDASRTLISSKVGRSFASAAQQSSSSAWYKGGMSAGTGGRRPQKTLYSTCAHVLAHVSS